MTSESLRLRYFLLNSRRVTCIITAKYSNTGGGDVRVCRWLKEPQTEVWRDKHLNFCFVICSQAGKKASSRCLEYLLLPVAFNVFKHLQRSEDSQLK